LIELEHHLSVKIMESPELLYLFFNPNSKEFCIFDHLIQFIHLDGHQGDVARVSFEMLLAHTSNPELEDYVLSTEFSTIIIASMAGLYTQLPNVNIDLWKSESKKDIEGFSAFYAFFESCLIKSTDKIKTMLFAQFKRCFLDQVVLSTLHCSSDFDGTAVSSLVYIQYILDHSKDAAMIQLLVEFLCNDDNDSIELNPRDLILSKLNSLSEQVVTVVLQLLCSCLAKYPPSLVLWIPSLASSTELGIHCIAIQDHVTLVTEYLGLLQSSADLDTYLSDALANMEALAAKLPNQNEDEYNDTIQIDKQVEIVKNDVVFSKLISKLHCFFSQSLSINLALTGLITMLASLPNPVLFRALFGIDSGLYKSVHQLLLEMKHHSQTLTNYSTRLMITRSNMLSFVVSHTENQGYLDDGEIIRNVVCFEEFLKEIVACLMMRGSTSKEHISYLL
jgi:hypothetical protein